MCLKSQPPDVGASDGNAHRYFYTAKEMINMATAKKLPSGSRNKDATFGVKKYKAWLILFNKPDNKKSMRTFNSCNTKIENPHNTGLI